jgi:predicted nuclease with TOPRIM domain
MSAPVKYTCPDIDRIIKDINDLLKIANKWEDESHYGEAEYYLYDIPDKLEELRHSNSSLRDWGEDLEKELDEKVKEISDLDNTVSTLTDEVERLKRILIENEIDF